MQLAKRLKGELVISLVRTFIARGIAALGGLLLAVVLGRLYGPAGVGVFALAQSLYMGAGILARYGMNNALMRYVGQDHQARVITIYLRWALYKAGLFSLVAGVAIFFLRGYLGRWFDAEALPGVLVGISLVIPAYTLASVLGGFMKGVRRPATACLLENGSISLVACALVLGLNALWPLVGIANAGWAFALAAWLVLVQGAWQTWCWLQSQNLHGTDDSVTQQEFATSSRAFFVLSLAQLMQQVVSVLIAGWLLSNADLGLFKAAERTALLINFILLVINAVLPPRFAALYRQQNMIRLDALARRGVLLGLALAAPMWLLCLLVPQQVLGLFGAEFIAAENLLRIIASAQLINVATGSVGFLLNMTGHEKLMRNIVLSCNALGLSMFLVLIPPFGALGAAWALALVLVLQNLTALLFVWRKLGIWMLPTPNLLKWMKTDTQEAT
ncbi:lipopolysaccharide biosynthesis protein [Litchfieldella rifensis]|uniref:Lipopolysaccharide biosynthesis protein n=1 Tax=Litchfieldella rifensis TaxID=762643 RepID=A0ABV7LMM9_9GAMM